METPFPAYVGDEPCIFVCYAHEDSDVVYPEMAWLREHGLNLWYDEGISAGTNWRAAIGDSLIRASRVLFYVSEGSLKSDHCNREINLALDEGKDVVPVYLEDVELTTDLKVGLNRVQALHRDQDASYQQHLLDALGPPTVVEHATATEPIAVAPQKKPSWPLYVGSVALVALGLGSWWLLSQWEGDPGASPLTGEAPIVAVLPLADMSAEGDQQYFGDGVAEEILTALARIEGIRVVARTSAFAFRGEQDTRLIAETLNATTILEGSVRKAKGRLRVTTQLIDASSGLHLWSNTYEGDVGDVFAFQADIAHQAAAALQDHFGFQTRANLSGDTGTPIDPQTYDLYLQALHQGSLGKPLVAITLLESVVRAEPDYAPAHALLSQSYMTLGGFGQTDKAAAAQQARLAALEALRLDPSSAAGHAALGRVQMQADWDWAAAEQSYEKASQLSASASHLTEHANLLIAVGHAGDAIEVARRAVDLDPLNWMTAHMLGRALSTAHQSAQALPHFARAKKLRGLPSYPGWAREDIIEAHWELRSYDNAVSEAQELIISAARRVEPANPESAWDYRAVASELDRLYKLRGFDTAWRYFADWYLTYDFGGVLEGWSMASCCSSQIARFYAQIGDVDRAIGLLRSAVETREWGIQWIRANPSFAGLHGKPAYRELLAEVGLPLVE